MAVDKIIDVIAVRHGGVPAVRTVHVVCSMAFAVVSLAAVRVCAAYLDNVLVVMPVVSAVQMAIVQVADVIAVPDGDVAAVRSMLMGVIFVNLVCHDVYSP